MAFDRQLTVPAVDGTLPVAGQYGSAPAHQEPQWSRAGVYCPYCERELMDGGMVGNVRYALVIRNGAWTESVVVPIPVTHLLLSCYSDCVGGQWVIPKDALNG